MFYNKLEYLTELTKYLNLTELLGKNYILFM
jgi:hypothetical protein